MAFKNYIFDIDGTLLNTYEVAYKAKAKVLKEYNITYKTAGENIANGQFDADDVMNSWLKSPGHRANILQKNFGKIGVGVFEYNGRLYWVQVFTN